MRKERIIAKSLMAFLLAALVLLPTATGITSVYADAGSTPLNMNIKKVNPIEIDRDGLDFDKGHTPGDNEIALSDGTDGLTKDHLDKVYLDGELLDAGDYTITDPFNLSLDKDIMDNLTVGKHIAEIHLIGGDYHKVIKTVEINVGVYVGPREATYTKDVDGDLAVDIANGIDGFTKENIEKITIDGKEIPKTAYTITDADPVRIVFDKEWLNGLSAGEHKIVFYMCGGEFDGHTEAMTITIVEPGIINAVKTGDYNIAIYVAAFLMIASGSIFYIARRKGGENNG